MTRFLTKWALAAALGAAGWALPAGPAAAQFYGGGIVRPGVTPFMGSPFMGSPFVGGPFMGSPFLASPYMGGAYSPYTIGNYSSYNPYTGSLTSYQYPAYQSNYGYSFLNPATGQMVNYQLNYAVPYNPASSYGVAAGTAGTPPPATGRP